MAKDWSVRTECAITLLKPEEGGRSSPPVLSGMVYRPRLVVGDPKQREAIAEGRGSGTEEYLGVAFENGPASVRLGDRIIATLVLLFYPRPAYDELKPGVAFTVREGSKVVGYGTVRRWLKGPASTDRRGT